MLTFIYWELIFPCILPTMRSLQAVTENVVTGCCKYVFTNAACNFVHMATMFGNLTSLCFRSWRHFIKCAEIVYCYVWIQLPLFVLTRYLRWSDVIFEEASRIERMHPMFVLTDPVILVIEYEMPSFLHKSTTWSSYSSIHQRTVNRPWILSIRRKWLRI